MESGWLLRNGEVLASTAQIRGWRARIVTTNHFGDGVGAVIVNGPAISVGVAFARLGEENRVNSLHLSRRPHMVTFSRVGIALTNDVASRVKVADELELRAGS